MKKILFIICFLASGQIVAQLDIGVKAGYHLNSLVLSDDAIDQTYNPGFHLGLFTEIDLGPITFQPEVLYETSGGQIMRPLEGTLDTMRHDLHAISIPGIIGLRLSALSLEFGASYNMIIDYRLRSNSGREVEMVDNNGWNASSDVRAIAGLSLRFSKIRAGVRATRSIQVFDTRSFLVPSGVPVNSDVRLMSFQASLGFVL